MTEVEKLTSSIRFSEEYREQEKHINIKGIYTFPAAAKGLNTFSFLS